MPTGFTVTPSIGLSVVQCIALTSANDSPNRDPSSYTLEGSFDGTNFFLISGGAVPVFPTRFFKNYIFFPNTHAYKSYRLLFPTVVNAPTAANSMQIAEVELLKALTPDNVSATPNAAAITGNGQGFHVTIPAQSITRRVNEVVDQRPGRIGREPRRDALVVVRQPRRGRAGRHHHQGGDYSDYYDYDWTFGRG